MKTDDGHISEDGTEFTVHQHIDNKEEIIDDDLSQEGDDITKLINIDVSTIPEEHRQTFTKLVDTLKGMTAEVSTLKEKVGLTDVLKQLAAGKSDITSKTDDGLTKAEKVVKKLSEELTFEEKDYYAPIFKKLADAIEARINEVREEVANVKNESQKDKVSSFEEKVRKFVSDNKIPPKVIIQMDNIAKEMGKGVYNNLEKLYKLAKLDLGIKDNVINFKDKQPNINGRVEMRGSMRKSNTQVNDKPVKTMEDAMGKAMEQLTDEAEVE